MVAQTQGGRELISKETFCQALQMIKEQAEIDSKVGDILELVCDGYFVFGAHNKNLNALLMVLKEAVNDQYDYIKWWLYDQPNDYMVWSADEKKEWCLKEPEALYDFIRDECQ